MTELRNSLFLRLRIICLAALLLMVVCSVVLPQEEILVPMRVQVPILMKILTFNRAMKFEQGSQLTIGILYQRGLRKSSDMKDEFIQIIKDGSTFKLNGITVRGIPIDLEEENDIEKYCLTNKVDVIYVTSIRSFSLESIITLSRKNHILSMTGIPEYVEEGISVGIGIRGEKPEILINRNAAIAEGAEFTAQLLNLSKIIK